ncbi:hypothetical protein CONPUDRAFT_159927 [Coniophora puteana RWD-64-598 SS2]|uniref:Uncharacterized protein n=1 Tax=Coniophora puteana (strain RWD-64-598) TaxID=741705 RepID=R7SEN6_CONPW|nr:uncharacterized protein CONPUDRAFT_159927 [Coniophora puteana RWD-64-598 SS2]EIW74638.1 hypothetical protein CONPUDRAFT_159927 [Coniophora puteana RWD-64-598 SS2]
MCHAHLPPLDIDGKPHCPMCGCELKPKFCSKGREDHIGRYFLVCDNKAGHPLTATGKGQSFWHWYPLNGAPDCIVLLADNSCSPGSSPSSSPPRGDPGPSTSSLPTLPPLPSILSRSTSLAAGQLAPQPAYPPLGPFVPGLKLKCSFLKCNKSAPNKANSRCAKTMCKKHCIQDFIGCSSAKDHRPECAGKLQQASFAALAAAGSSTPSLASSAPRAPRAPRAAPATPSQSLTSWPDPTDEEWGLNPQFDDLSVLSEVAVNFPEFTFSSVDSPPPDSPVPPPSLPSSFLPTQLSAPPPSQPDAPAPSQPRTLTARTGRSSQPRGLSTRSAPTTQLNDSWQKVIHDVVVEEDLLQKDEQEQLSREEESCQEIELITYIENNKLPIKLALQGSNVPSHRDTSPIPHWPYFDLAGAADKTPQLPKMDHNTHVEFWDGRRKHWKGVSAFHRIPVKNQDVLVFRINGTTACVDEKTYTSPCYKSGLPADRLKIRAKLKEPVRSKRARSPTPEPSSSSQASSSTSPGSPSSSQASEDARSNKRLRTVSPFVLSPNRAEQMLDLAFLGGPQPPGPSHSVPLLLDDPRIGNTPSPPGTLRDARIRWGQADEEFKENIRAPADSDLDMDKKERLWDKVTATYKLKPTRSRRQVAEMHQAVCINVETSPPSLYAELGSDIEGDGDDIVMVEPL